MRDIFILIPAFNEEATIFNVVQSCVAIAREVIVVNDGSTDETGNLARKAGATVIDKSKNEGYESALNTGFKFAVERLGDASSLVTFDADGEHSVPSLLNMINARGNESANLLIGRRKRFNRYAEHIVGLWGRIFLGIPDPLCGMRVYDLASSRVATDSFKSGLAGLDILVTAKSRGLTVSSYPVPVGKRSGPSKFGISINGEAKVLVALFRAARQARESLS